MVSVSSTRHTNLVETVTNGLPVTLTNVSRTYWTNVFFVYQATLSGLRSGAEYVYSVELDGRRTTPRRFRTLGGPSEPVRFIAYGDSRSNPKIHRTLAQQFLRQAPDFVLHTGDLVEAGRDYARWSREFFEPVANVADQVPFLSVPGNHEDDLKNYLAYFPIRGSNRWYSFDAGPVHVLALDYHFERDTHAQFEFARQDLLASKAPWKVVMVHNPIFNFGGHNSAWGHRHYLPLFYEAQVDLVLSGHSHTYERYRPVTPAGNPNGWPLTAIITAGGGAELHQPWPHPAQAVSLSTNHFTVIEATTNLLKVWAIRTDGAAIDAFEIRKTGGRHSPHYLAQTYPLEWIKLSYEMRPQLQGRLASLPTNKEPAKVMLTFAPLSNAPPPLELAISLTPQSAKYYVLDNAPLRVTPPAPGESNKVVWATVRSTGRRPVKGPTLDPPLNLQARVQSGAHWTLAYGQDSRISGTAAAAAKKLAAAQLSTHNP
jgi:predicted phosphodiesterase